MTGTLKLRGGDDVVVGRIEPALFIASKFIFRGRWRASHGFRNLALSGAVLLLFRRPISVVGFTKYLQIREIFRYLVLNNAHAHYTLQGLYTATNWPTSENLMNLRTPTSALANSLDPQLRDDLRASISEVPFFSWRIANNGILGSSRLRQRFAFCYVIALIRQFEASSKKQHFLPLDESLSIQDFINHIPEHMINAKGVDDQGLVDILVQQGVLLSQPGESPTFVRAPPTLRFGLEIYRPTRAHVAVMDSRYDQCFELLAMELFSAPVAASVVWFRSYNNYGDVHEVLSPTPEELASYNNYKNLLN